MLNVLNKANAWLTTRRVKILFVAYTILLFLVAVLPINSASATINHTFIISIRLDYLLHFSIFIPWMFLMRRHSRISFQHSKVSPVIWIFAGLLFAVFTEVVQYGLPYREFNINDLLANGMGVLLGAVVFMR